MILKGEWAELERVDLRGAELQERKFPLLCLAHSNLEGANLAGAKLYHATLIDTVLRKANLSRADLREADLTGADLEGAVLLGADLTDAIWPPTVAVPAGRGEGGTASRRSPGVVPAPAP
ncbi:MAG: pentapeptide repeat-containing protein [Streptosporangiaceae bacterium]